MPATPRGRSPSRRRTRCKCLGGRSSKGDRATPCCSLNPLKSLFRCPGGRGRSRSRGGKHRQRTPSKVRDAPAGAGGDVQPQQGQEEEPSFFVYAMPNLGGFGGGAEHKNKKKKKRRTPRMPSFGSCFRSNKKKKERKQAKAAAAAATASVPRPALTPASSLLTHPPGSPTPPEKTQAASPSMTQPPSPAPTEIGSAISSPAPPGRRPATPRPGDQATDSARSPLAPQQPKQVEGLEIVEVATGERLSAHELSLIEMVGSSADGSAESSVKSSLEYASEPPPVPQPPAKRAAAVVERKAETVKVREGPKLWLNGKSAESRARERFAKPLVPAEAEELWAHDVACSRVHATMLAETVSSSSSLMFVYVESN
ncbi:unnamed protein product [Urochloa humidicola]